MQPVFDITPTTFPESSTLVLLAACSLSNEICCNSLSANILGTLLTLVKVASFITMLCLGFSIESVI